MRRKPPTPSYNPGLYGRWPVVTYRSPEDPLAELPTWMRSEIRRKAEYLCLTARLVVVSLWRRGALDGTYASYEELSQDTGCSVAAIRKALAKLERLELLVYVTRRGRGRKTFFLLFLQRGPKTAPSRPPSSCTSSLTPSQAPPPRKARPSSAANRVFGGTETSRREPPRPSPVSGKGEGLRPVTDAAVRWALGELRGALGEVFTEERVDQVMLAWVPNPDLRLCVPRIQKTVLHAFAVALWPLKGQGDVRILTELVARCENHLLGLGKPKLSSLVWNACAGRNGLRPLIAFARWLVNSVWQELLSRAEFPGLDVLPPLRLAHPLTSPVVPVAQEASAPRDGPCAGAVGSSAGGAVPTERGAPSLPCTAGENTVAGSPCGEGVRGRLPTAGGLDRAPYEPEQDMSFVQAWRIAIALLKQAYEKQLRLAANHVLTPN